jgi:ABC-type nitrate/sulfonate/bicarbonate transport system ATPase subunit
VTNQDIAKYIPNAAVDYGLTEAVAPKPWINVVKNVMNELEQRGLLKNPSSSAKNPSSSVAPEQQASGPTPQQRAALARGLQHRSEVLLVDYVLLAHESGGKREVTDALGRAIRAIRDMNAALAALE